MAQALLIFLVRVYRWVLSPAKTVFFGPLGRCRFTPSCSDYALQALQAHGALLGVWLSLKRICRCHPWGGCGHDPVPAPPAFGESSLKSRISFFRGHRNNFTSSTGSLPRSEPRSMLNSRTQSRPTAAGFPLGTSGKMRQA